MRGFIHLYNGANEIVEKYRYYTVEGRRDKLIEWKKSLLNSSGNGYYHILPEINCEHIVLPVKKEIVVKRIIIKNKEVAEEPKPIIRPVAKYDNNKSLYE